MWGIEQGNRRFLKEHAPGPKTHEVNLVLGATVRGKVVKDGKPVAGITLLLGTPRVGTLDGKLVAVTLASCAGCRWVHRSSPALVLKT